jgi:choline dehydrogenase-like flavoprotein
MDRDAMSVVDGKLKVYGIAGLRIADASIMPRVTTGNTMVPCAIIGDRAAEILRTEHELQTSVIHKGGDSPDSDPGSLKALPHPERIVV